MDRLEIARYSTLAEAELVVSLLKRHGIDAEVADRETANSLAYAQIALGGVRITAPDFQIVQARDVIKQARDGVFDEDGNDEDGEWTVDHTPGRVGELDDSEIRGVLGSMKSLTRTLILVILFGPLILWLLVSMFAN